MSKPRILVLGAGFGGLELTTHLSEALGDGSSVTLIDKSDSFIFGFSKLDVMFGRLTADAVRVPYAGFAKPGVRMLRETSPRSIPAARRVTTDAGVHDADFLVIALGADYDVSTHTRGHARPQRVLHGRRRRAAARRAAHVHCGPRSGRRVRRAVQVPAGTERVRPDAARLPRHARRARRVRDHARQSAAEPGAAFARDVAGAAGGVRRARHQVHPEPARRVGRRGAPRGRARRRQRAAVSICSSASRRTAPPTSWSRAGMTENGWVTGRSAHARDAVSPTSTPSATWRQHGRAEGRRVRRGRRARPLRPT